MYCVPDYEIHTDTAISSLGVVTGLLKWYTAKTLVLKVTPLVLIEDHTKWVLNVNTKIITPITPAWYYFNTLGIKITPIGVKI